MVLDYTILLLLSLLLLKFLCLLVQDKQPDLFCIGVTDITSELEFRYINSGEKVSEEYWSKGQPDNDDQHCVDMCHLRGGFRLYDFIIIIIIIIKVFMFTGPG